MELFLDKRASTMEFEGTVSVLLRELKVMREEVVIKINGKLAPETSRIKPDDKVEIIKVVFGG